ncbi:MAG TPA: CDP-alcohol phosphatidyltransferase family protein [Allosphingosinicella sp.]|jgi:phosphatidylglycerophosphate synthase
MQCEKPVFGHGRPLLLFRDADSAGRPIAGVAAAARAAAVLVEDGAREIWIALEKGGQLSDATIDDLRRACPDTGFRYGGGEGVPAIRGEEIIPPGSDSAAARQVLRETAKESDGIVSKYLNRPLSRALSALFLQIPGFRPVHATFGTAILGIAMAIALLTGGKGGLILGGLLFHAASVFDGVDGEVARATYRSSARGALLDTIVDMMTNFLFYVGITFSLTRIYGSSQAMVGGWAVAAGLTGMLILGWIVRQVGEPGNFDLLKRFYRDRYTTGFPRLIVDAVVMITSRDFFAFGSAVLIVTGHPKLVTLGLALFASLWVVLILIALPHMMRRAGAGHLAGAPQLP